MPPRLLFQFFIVKPQTVEVRWEFSLRAELLGASRAPDGDGLPKGVNIRRCRCFKPYQPG